MHPIQAQALEVRRRLQNLAAPPAPPAPAEQALLKISAPAAAETPPKPARGPTRTEIEDLIVIRLEAAKAEWFAGERARQEQELKVDAERIARNAALLEAVDAALDCFNRVRDSLDLNVHVLSRTQKNRQIVHAVCRQYKLSVAELIGPSRVNVFVRPRHVAMYLLRELGQRSYPEIGRIIGGRDHATVRAGCFTIIRVIGEKDEELLADIAAIKQQLGAS